ncbi:MAG: hypothetical protein EOP49_41875 [Sphingobacteriales bacterium]|nr:MAG: hypothetical protein EOP49_41875 [Sphingobacteriales bacterium]
MIHTIVFSLGIIFMVAIAIVLIVFIGNKSSQRRRTQMDGLLSRLASWYGLRYSHKDAFGDRMLALDDRKRILVYIDYSGRIKHQVVRLKELSETQIVESGISHIEYRKYNGPVSEDRSKNFSLALILRNGTVVDIPIYTEKEDGLSQRGKLLMLARKWKQELNSFTRRRELQLG